MTGSAKYTSAPRIKRAVPNALVAGACVAVKLVKPNTPALHKRVFVDAFKVKVNLLRAGGWLTEEQAVTLKNLAGAL